MRRRDVLKLGALGAVTAACETTPPSTTLMATKSRTDAWNAVMTADPGEFNHMFHASVVDGKIPEGLFGQRYLLNGPARVTYGKGLAHPFDGHGFLRAFSFSDDGSAHVDARFIKTTVFLEEERQNRLVYPGLGTLPDPGPDAPAKITRNTANTTIARFGDRLLAGYEGGRPWALDPRTLETRGEESFGGVLPDAATLAHMRIDDEKKRLVTLSPGMGRETTLVFREFDESFRLLSTVTTSFPGIAFIHDFVITKSSYVIALNPLSIDVIKFIKAQIGSGTLIESLKSGDGEGGIVVVPRREAGENVEAARVMTLPTKAFVVHFGSAYDDGDDLVIDACAFPKVTFGQEFGYRGPSLSLDPGLSDVRPPQRLVRYRGKNARGPVDGDVTLKEQVLVARGVDFPRTHPRRDGAKVPALYAATRMDTAFSDPFDAVMRVDMLDLEREPQLFSVDNERFLGEPLFIPHHGAKDDDDGSVVVMAYDGAKRESTLLILSPKNLAGPPLAQIKMPLLPMGFHGGSDDGGAI